MKSQTILYLVLMLMLISCSTRSKITNDYSNSEYIIFEDSSKNRFVYAQLKTKTENISKVQKIRDNSLSFNSKGLVYSDENGSKTLFNLNKDLSQDMKIISWLKDSKNTSITKSNENPSQKFDRVVEVKGIGFSEYDLDGNLPPKINCNCQNLNSDTNCDSGGEGSLHCEIEERSQLKNLICIVSCSEEYYSCCSK